MQAIIFGAVASLAAPAFWTPNDPFVGKWRLDLSRSTIVDGMQVETLGPSTYRFSFEGAPAETIIADGTDQPGLPGTTLSVRSEDARTLTVVRKQAGQVIVSASWKLSTDGKSMHDAFTSLQPDGSMLTVDYLYKRVSGGSGFRGSWESTTKPVGLKLELAISPYANKGLSFVGPGSEKSVVFDGHPHPLAGDKSEVTVSGRRRGPRTMEYAERKGAEIVRARHFKLSRDGRTLTEIVSTNGRTIPDVLVFDRK